MNRKPPDRTPGGPPVPGETHPVDPAQEGSAAHGPTPANGGRTATGASMPGARGEPARAETEFSPAELDFIKAMDEYKKSSGRMFPTWSEILEVLKGIGYEKPHDNRSVPAPETPVDPVAEMPVTGADTTKRKRSP